MPVRLPPAQIRSQPHHFHFARRYTWPATRSDSTARPQSLLHSTTAPRAVRAGCDPLAHAASAGRCHVMRRHATRTHTELHARQAQSFCPPILQQSYEGITTQVRVWRDRHNRMRGCRRHGIGTTDTRDEDGRAAQSERGGNAGKQRDFECAVRSSQPARPVLKKLFAVRLPVCHVEKRTGRLRHVHGAQAAHRQGLGGVSFIHPRRNVHVDSIFELLGLRVLARSLIVSALLGPVAAIVDITPAAAAVLAVIQE